MSDASHTVHDILHQLGCYRSDAAFMSLNLSPLEWDVMQRALAAAPQPADGRIETQLTAILSQWLAAKMASHDTATA